MLFKPSQNKTKKDILKSMLMAFVALFFNGFGVYLTIRANIGPSPWDVLNLGISKTFGILYGTASIIVSFCVLAIDVAIKEPIGIAMIIDAITVGKSVDFFNWIDIFPVPKTILGSIVMMFVGFVILGYTTYFYMLASLGCGPRDTLTVGLRKKFNKVPIGIIWVALLSIVTIVGYLLGGQSGFGTVLCALCLGPIIQYCFETVKFDPTIIHHQNIKDTIKIILNK